MAQNLITGAVLVGGRSRRLGRDKARLLLAGRPLAHWVMDAVSPLVDEYWLISNQPLEHLSLGFPLLIDVVPGRGALGGLLSAMLMTRGSHVLLSACDTPFLQPALLEAMITQARRGGQDAVVCRSSRGLEPLPGMFSCRLLQRLQAQVQGEDLRLRTLLNSCRSRVLPPEEVARYDAAELSFLNINTAEDATKAAALARAGFDRFPGKSP
jgi:molybdopterin-guanine dinucleotide biosynthesis protein A